jgi:hypothetical protein
LHRHRAVFLDWLRNLLPAVQQRAGNLYGALQMNDDDTDSGGDFFIDMIKTAIAVGFFLLLVVTIGAVVWRFVA